MGMLLLVEFGENHVDNPWISRGVEDGLCLGLLESTNEYASYCFVW